MTLDFSLTQEQEAIRDLAHEFAEREIRPVAAHYDETEGFPYEVVNKAHKLGLTPAAFLSEEYGGQILDSWVYLAWLAAPFRYRSLITGQEGERPAWLLVSHMFNHQTHHRGQLTTLLTQFGLDIGVTDLAAMPLPAAD